MKNIFGFCAGPILLLYMSCVTATAGVMEENSGQPESQEFTDKPADNVSPDNVSYEEPLTYAERPDVPLTIVLSEPAIVLSEPAITNTVTNTVVPGSFTISPDHSHNNSMSIPSLAIPSLVVIAVSEITEITAPSEIGAAKIETAKIETAKIETGAQAQEIVPPAAAVVPAAPAMSPEEPEAMQEAETPVPNMTIVLSGEKTGKVTLHGRGWVFIGSNSEGDSEIEFYSKSHYEDQEQFLFRVYEPVETRMLFQRQDLSSGTIEYKTINIQFVLHAADSEINSPPPITSGSLGNSEILIEEVEKTDISILSAEELEKLAQYYEKSGDIRRSLEMFEYLQSMYPAYRHSDRVMYSQAQILENPEIRDIRKSLVLYREILTLHPFSPYTSMAGERIRFIERNIIRIF
ncbi:MAG: tetratricopeptide repeat protein [Salinispira sp.]